MYWPAATISPAENAAKQLAQLAEMAHWYAPTEVLKKATADNAELLVPSGQRSRSASKLGFVEEGVLADLLLMEANSIANLKLLKDPAKNFVGIMKDRKICKNTLKYLGKVTPSPIWLDYFERRPFKFDGKIVNVQVQLK